MDAMGQIFHISKFSDTLSFFIIPRMLRRNLTKIGHYIPSFEHCGTRIGKVPKGKEKTTR